MPKVWTLRQRGISSPAPARSVEQRQAEQASEEGDRHRHAGRGATSRGGQAAEAAGGRSRSRRVNPGRRRPAPAAAAAARSRLDRSRCKPPFRQEPALRRRPWVKMASRRPGPADRGRSKEAVEKATRRGNYESGSDYVLEYGELRFSFNEQDFAQRVEQAAVKLDFVDQGLERRGAPGPARAGRQRRDPRAVLGRSASTSSRTGPSWSARRTAASCTGSAGSSSAAPGSTSGSRRASWTSSSTPTPTPSATSSPTATPSRSSSRASPPGLASPTGASQRLERASSSAFEGVPSIRSRSSAAASAGVEVGEQRAQPADRLQLVRLAQLVLVGDPALGGDDRRDGRRPRRARGRG